MIGRLVGSIVDQEDLNVVVDVAGVGYDVMVPEGTLTRASRDSHDRLILWIHTVVREDAFLLYGFATQRDRSLFRLLIGIANVGPKTAVTILSVLAPEDLINCVLRNDSKRLVAVPGIGKKTADRLLLELKDKIGLLSPPGLANEARVVTPLSADTAKADMLHKALLELQFRPTDVDRVVAQLADRIPSLALNELIVAGLQLLHR